MIFLPNADLVENTVQSLTGFSDTTGATLANMFYYFAKYPHTYQRLQREIDEIKASGGSVTHAPYLNAAITETLRLRPVVPSGLNRLTPPEGLMVDGVWIPGDTHVITPQYVIQRSEGNYERAFEFIPERWMDEGKHLYKDERAWFPFSTGKMKEGFYSLRCDLQLTRDSLQVYTHAWANQWRLCRCIRFYIGSRVNLISLLRLERMEPSFWMRPKIILRCFVHRFIWFLINGMGQMARLKIKRLEADIRFKF